MGRSLHRRSHPRSPRRQESATASEQTCTDMSLRQRSLALVILPLGLVFALVLVIAVFGARIQQAEGVASGTNAGLAASNDLLVDLQSAEVAANGYALTGNLKFLQPYGTARAGVESGIEGLRNVARSEWWADRYVPRLAEMARNELANLDRYVALARAGH